MGVRPSAVVCLLALLLTGPLVDGAVAADAESLITSRTGNLPILLTVPHGGSDIVPNVPVRSRGITGTDAHTIELMEALTKHLERGLGATPYVVAARFSRKYIDANRKESDAFDSPDARPAYDAYHGRIRGFIAQMRERFPRGPVLLDIHGQSTEPDVLIRGTRNGLTVGALLRNHGPDALIGPNSVFGVVQRRGYKVFPPNTPIGNPSEDRRYGGGPTVHMYGSNNPDGIDAIQLEVGRAIRTDAGFIAALGEGIIAFYKAYLQPSQ